MGPLLAHDHVAVLALVPAVRVAVAVTVAGRGDTGPEHAETPEHGSYQGSVAKLAHNISTSVIFDIIGWYRTSKRVTSCLRRLWVQRAVVSPRYGGPGGRP
ncbi:hypothetical protein GCM10010353_67180 [Streptomyces chryseus]|nr:hypothetical protein GCM10010353_67180 [Streptomyces chryseus]